MTDPGNLASTSNARSGNPGMDTIWKAAAYGELALVQVCLSMAAPACIAALDTGSL